MIKLVSALLKAEITLKSGGVAVPSFMLMVEEWLDEKYSPEATEDRTGISASQSIIWQKSIADAAFTREVVINEPWVD